MVVLGISDPHYVVLRQFQQGQRGFKTAGLADTGGEHHHGAFVENNLQLEPEVAYHLQHHILMRLPGRNDAASGRYRHLARLQPIKKRLRRFWPEQRLLAGLWIEKDASILGDDQIKKRNLGKNLFKSGS
jgi:hypothetical protein